MTQHASFLPEATLRVLSRMVIVLYIFMLLWLVLFKFSFDIASVLDYQMRSLNLLPFADATHANLVETISNLIVFIPLGLLLGANFARANLWQKLAVVCAFSLGVETLQFALAIGVTDVTDVITNTTGGLFGLLMYELGNRLMVKERLHRFIAMTGATLLTILLGLLLSGTLGFRPPTRPDGGMTFGTEQEVRR